MTARLYRLLLLAYPRPFRRRFASDMTAAFVQLAKERRARGGRLALCALWGRTLADVLVNAVGEHAATRRSLQSEPRRGRNMSNLWSSIFQDVRYALRTMRRAPGVTAVVVLTMALGMGASSAIVSLVRAVILRPPPYANPNELLTIWNEEPTGSRVATGWLGPRLGERLTPIAPPYVTDVRERSTSFSALAGFSPSWDMTLTGTGDASRVDALYVSEGLLAMLGLAPQAGRDFTRDDHRPGSAPVALVSSTMWSRIGGQGVLDGKTIDLNSEPYTVVGILPEAARLPGTPGDIWIPLVRNPFAQARQVTFMTVLARLRPGVSMDAARQELQSVAQSLERDFPQRKGHGLTIVPLSERMSRRSRPLLLVLGASVLLLVLIAIANVANLLLARASVRRREIAVRTALGAGRWRLLRLAFTESILLGLAGAAAGLFVARWTLGSLVALLERDLPPGADVRVDAFVLLTTGALAVLAGLAFGLAPALEASSSGPADALRQGARAGMGGRRLRQALVTLEVALAFVLLTGAGLLLRSFWRLTDVNPGFRTERVVSAPIGLPQAAYPTAANRAQFFDRLQGRIRALPGVESAALVNRLPLGGSTNNAVDITIEGQPPAPQPINVDRRIASPQYFATLGIPLVAGRMFEESDAGMAAPVAVVNDEMARRLWPDGNAIGSRVRIALLSGPGPWLTVVGVVGSVRHHGLDADVRPELWVPYAQASVNGMVLVARTSMAPEALLDPIRRSVHEIDAELPVTPTTLEAVVAHSISGPRSRTILLSAFAVLALLLATIGIAGVVAFTVSRMTRDIGVRVALGADRRAILALVLRQALTPACAGLAIGVAAGLIGMRTLTSLLFDIRPSDPLTFVSVGIALLVVAAAASLLPAIRASRIDPVTALRVE